MKLSIGYTLLLATLFQEKALGNGSFSPSSKPSTSPSDFPSAFPSSTPTSYPSAAPTESFVPSSAPSVQTVVETSDVGGGDNNVCMAEYSIVSGGGNNTILESVADRRQLQGDNLGAHTITGGSMNKIQCIGPGSTITGGSFNSITNQCEYSTIVGGTANTIKGAGATIGAGKRNSISLNGKFGTILAGKGNKVKATGATVCAGTKNEALGDFSSIGSGNNNKAEGEYSTIPGGRNNKAKGKGSIVFGQNGRADHNNALIINIPLQSGKRTLKSASAASFNAAANRFIFHIEKTKVKITRDNIGNIKQVLPSLKRRHLLPAVRLTVDDIRTLIVEKEAILEEQQDTLSELEQELDELWDKVELDASVEVKVEVHPISRKLKSGLSVVAGGLDNTAPGFLSVVNGGEGNEASGTSSVVGGGLNNVSAGTNSVVGGGESNEASGASSAIGGGFKNLAQGQDGFLGGGEKNQLKGQLAALGGGKLNIVTKSSVGSCLGGGFKNIVKGLGNYVGGGKKNLSKTQGSYATILGGLNNLVDGNYAIAMGQNAQALNGNCMAIGLEPNSRRYARARQKGDFLIRSQIIELRTGRNTDGTPKGTLILNKDNIKAFKRLVKGATRRREEAQTEEELNLLTELEDLEDTVDEYSSEIEDIQYTIKDVLHPFSADIEN